MTTYEKMIDRLKKQHDLYVKQNWMINGLQLAIEQVHSEGDIHTDYAVEVLMDELQRLKKANDDTRNELYARRNFVIEYANDEELDDSKIKEIFGY